MHLLYKRPKPDVCIDRGILSRKAGTWSVQGVELVDTIGQAAKTRPEPRRRLAPLSQPWSRRDHQGTSIRKRFHNVRLEGGLSSDLLYPARVITTRQDAVSLPHQQGRGGPGG
jgi:hypothetical protein